MPLSEVSTSYQDAKAGRPKITMKKLSGIADERTPELLRQAFPDEEF